MGKYTGLGMSEHSDELHTNITKTLFINSVNNHQGNDTKSLGIALDPDAAEKVNYSFFCPTDFVAWKKISFVLSASTDEGADDVYLACTVQAGGEDEIYTTHESGEYVGCSIPANDQYVNRYFEIPLSVLDNVGIGDIIGLYIIREATHMVDQYTGDIIIRGILIEYEASQ